jgi:BMFP domain-containing protein YqiC
MSRWRSIAVATLEERVAYLEGRLEDHASTVIDVRSGLTHLDAKLSRLDAKIDSVESRLTTRIDGVENRLTTKIDRHFTWLVGIQVAVLLALVGALLGG